MNNPSRTLLRACFDAGVNAVGGRQAVTAQADWLRSWSPEYVVAMGKAACAMVQGLEDISGVQVKAGLVVTAEDYCDSDLPDRYERVFGEHPLPGEGSLLAGERLLAFLARLPSGSRLLVLISGGASSQLECLREGYSLSQLQRLNQWLLGSGLDIRAMNHFRARISRLKGGGLARFVRHLEVQAGFISDVAGDDPAVIASGPLLQMAEITQDISLPQDIAQWLPPVSDTGGDELQPAIPHYCIASLSHARVAACVHAEQAGLPARVDETFLAGEAEAVADKLLCLIKQSPAGILVLGGEPTVRLPRLPGSGGRNQHLALLLASRLAQENTVATVLCGATDGHDGNSHAAGAIVDNHTCQRLERLGMDIASTLENADSGRVFQLSAEAIAEFASGTNVMDLVIVYLPENAGLA